MKLLLAITILYTASFASTTPPRTCVEILDQIKILEKQKQESERGNYEGIERIASAILTRTVYVGDRRSDGTPMDIKQEISVLKSKIPNCPPY